MEEKDIVQNLKTKDLVKFDGHPYKVRDEDLDELLASIKEFGIRTPIVVRKKNALKYEIISGHRRKRAAELLGLERVPCIVKDLDDPEAIIEMVDSNIQRAEILPSEKGFAYKMKLEAIKKQGERTDLATIRENAIRSRNLTSCQVGTKSEWRNIKEKSTSCPVGTKLNEQDSNEKSTSCPVGTKLNERDSNKESASCQVGTKLKVRDIKEKSTSCPVDTKLNERDSEEESTLCPVGTKLSSIKKVSDFDSSRQVYRYIRLTFLLPRLMKMVDEKRIAIRPAVSISYLTEQEQLQLLYIIEEGKGTPTIGQAEALKKLSQKKELTEKKMIEIMSALKCNQKDKYGITYQNFEKLLPKNVVTPIEVEAYLMKCAAYCMENGIDLKKLNVDKYIPPKPKRVERSER